MIVIFYLLILNNNIFTNVCQWREKDDGKEIGEIRTESAKGYARLAFETGAPF